MRSYGRRFSVLCLSVVLVAGACGGDSKDDEAQGGSAGGSVAESKEAVIQIDVTGTFADLEEGEVTDQEGRGSGFIISEDGLAVTNNHVVTGATKIKVRVPGQEEEVSAKVLGASECADLAVIDMEGEGYKTLAFAEEPADIGEEVSAVGYPLGVRELTLKAGVVEKVVGPKATDWAAVPGVMQHSAEIKPGNSGGPLVNKDGQVVGVNYAGSEAASAYFAITGSVAKGIVAKLRKGQEVETLGVNAQAISVGEDTGGVFVASLRTGSAPDKLGVKAGDVLLRLEEQPLANDGTMADYCDVLRSRDTAKPLRVALARLEGPETVSFYSGTLNQDGSLQALDLGTGADGAAPPPEGVPDLEALLAALPDGTEHTDIQTLTDDTASLVIRAPASWGQSQKAPANPLTGGGRPLPSISVAPDLATFAPGDYTIPGVAYYAFPNTEGTVETAFLLEAFDGVPNCTYGGAGEFPSEIFKLFVQFWTSCGGTPTFVVRTAATPFDRTEIITGTYIVTTKADLVVLLEGLLTFGFDPAAFEAWKAANPS